MSWTATRLMRGWSLAVAARHGSMCSAATHRADHEGVAFVASHPSHTRVPTTPAYTGGNRAYLWTVAAGERHTSPRSSAQAGCFGTKRSSGCPRSAEVGRQRQKPTASELVRAVGFSCCAGRRDLRSVGGLTRFARRQEVAAAGCDAEDVSQSPGQLLGQASHLL